MRSPRLYGILLLPCLLATLISAAQKTGSITGRVKDSAGVKDLPYVTVELFRGDAKEPIQSVFTNDKGQYNLVKLDSGKYTLLFTHTGFATQSRDLFLEPGQARV